MHPARAGLKSRPRIQHMKKLLFLLGLLFPMLATAQILPYRYGSAAPPLNQSFIASLNYYPFEANDSVWQFYGISNSGTNIWLAAGSTNNVMLVPGATVNQTNILVFPNATNSVGAVFNIITTGAITTILSNSVTGSFNNITNPPGSGATSPSTYQVQSNRVVKVFTPTGTNWFIMDLRGNVP